MTPLQALERIIKNVQAYTNIDIEQELDTIAEALHVPSADEICEELRKETGLFISYHKGENSFCFVEIKEQKLVHIIYLHRGYLYISQPLPPYLITLIARFYEAQE